MSDQKKPNWTESQKKAIDARDGTIIVSAAAGSGKTAVLTERIVKLLEEGTTSLDRMLIVTFTRAATAEMKERIGKAIDAHINEAKDETTADILKKQKVILPSANISTIDSFCGNIVRNHFQDFPGLAPDYEIIDEVEAKNLKLKTLNDVLDEYYEANDQVFLDLVKYFAYGATNDDNLISTISTLYTYSRSYTSPETWLKTASEIYNPKIAFKDSPIVEIIIKHKTEEVESTISKMEDAVDLFNKYENPAILKTTAYSLLTTELDILKSNLECLKNKDFSSIQEVNQGRWNVGDFKDEPEIIAIKNMRVDATKVFKDISIVNEAEFQSQCKELFPLVSKLIEITIKFSEKFYRAKFEKNALEFSDIAMMALKLLVEEETRVANRFDAKLVKTPLAEEISEEFDFILIDEYQDTNILQDMLFRAISKDEENLFMVGDVKQSIYRFRQAMPDIFIDKCENFKKYNINKIILGENFRSREGIIDFVNFVFKQICSKECGDVDYNEDEALKFARDNCKPTDEPDVEIHLIQAESADDGLVREGRLIADYIKNHVKGDTHYKDFTILMRAPGNGKAEIICKELQAQGIPYYNSKDSSYLDTTDVQIVISLLKVIDNPLNDIPLLAVLLSPIFNLTPDDVALFKIGKSRNHLYQNMLESEKKGDKKAKYVLDKLRDYRRLSVTLSAGELVRRIYEDTLYQSIAGVLPNGQQRTANLLLLQTYADSYDKTNALGISGFIRYLDKVISTHENVTPASLSSENSDVVQISTIHSSKGLQYKYCILAGTGSSINSSDYLGQFLLNSDYGIGLKGYDDKLFTTYDTIANTAISLENETKAKSEHIRLLYVALTRAKDKLLITGSITSDVDKFISNTRSVKEKTSMLDLIIGAILHHPSGKPFVDLAKISVELYPANSKILCKYYDLSELSETKVAETKEMASPDSSLTKEFTDRQAYQYPYEPLSKVPTKRAASATETLGFNERYFANARPEFATNQGLTPTQKGTALHTFMQYADLSKDPVEELKRLTEQRFITEQQAEVIDTNKVISFQNSGIYSRIKNSSNVWREKKFAVLIPANKLNNDLPKELGEEKILIQGIADCIFEEDGELVILDYKTDRTTDENELIERHAGQLATYKEALEQALDMHVKEVYLYAFSLDKEIKISL